MSLQAAIWAELSDAAAVTALVGSDIYAGRVPTSAGDTYISYTKISNVHVRHVDGGSGLATARVQVDCVAPKPDSAYNVYDAVRRTLDNFRGTLGTGSNTLTVRSCVLDNDREVWAQPVAARQEGPCREAMDFLITYVETAVDNIE